jgi:hypothetical protein
MGSQPEMQRGRGEKVIRRSFTVLMASFAVVGALLSPAAADEGAKGVQAARGAAKAARQEISVYLKCNGNRVAMGYQGEPLGSYDWYGLYDGQPNPFDYRQGAAVQPVGFPVRFTRVWQWATHKEYTANLSRGRYKVLYWSWDDEQQRYYIVKSTLDFREIKCS